MSFRHCFQFSLSRQYLSSERPISHLKMKLFSKKANNTKDEKDAKSRSLLDPSGEPTVGTVGLEHHTPNHKPKAWTFVPSLFRKKKQPAIVA